MWIKEASKGGLKWPNIGKTRVPNQNTQRAQNSGPDRAEPTTARVGRRTAVRPARTVVRAYVVWGFPIFAWLFYFSCVFLLLCLYNMMYLDIMGSQSIPYHTLFHLPRVRVVLEKERGRGEELQGFWIGFCDRKVETRFWMSKFFPFSSFFSFYFYVV